MSEFIASDYETLKQKTKYASWITAVQNKLEQPQPVLKTKQLIGRILAFPK